MNIFIYHVVILALSFNPQWHLGKEREKPDYVKDIHVVVWTAAVPEPGVFGALWVTPEAQVPLEIITVP